MTSSGGAAAVPEEAVEAAAKLRHAEKIAGLRDVYPPGVQFRSWDQLAPETKDSHRLAVAPFLAAAFPVIREAVLREAADEWDEVRRIDGLPGRESTAAELAKWDRSRVAITDRCMAGDHDFGAWLRLVADGGSSVVDNNGSEQRCQRPTCPDYGKPIPAGDDRSWHASPEGGSDA